TPVESASTGKTSAAPEQRAHADEQVAGHLRPVLLRLARLERLADQPLLEELTAGSEEVVREEEDRLRRGLHLRPGGVRQSDCPATKLGDLGAVHPAIFHTDRVGDKTARTTNPANSHEKILLPRTRDGIPRTSDYEGVTR